MLWYFSLETQQKGDLIQLTQFADMSTFPPKNLSNILRFWVLVSFLWHMSEPNSWLKIKALESQFLVWIAFWWIFIVCMLWQGWVLLQQQQKISYRWLHSNRGWLWILRNILNFSSFHKNTHSRKLRFSVNWFSME